MRLVNHEPQPFLKGHPQHEYLVLGLDRFQQRARAHLAELALGLDIGLGHLAPPA